MSEENPYQPPASGPLPEPQSRTCPDCGHEMEPGEARGSLHWTEEGTSTFRRMVAPGKPLIGAKSFRITMTAPWLDGHHCGNCGLTILKAPHQEPDR
jgi:ribosomal protein S27AE